MKSVFNWRILWLFYFHHHDVKEKNEKPITNNHIIAFALIFQGFYVKRIKEQGRLR